MKKEYPSDQELFREYGRTKSRAARDAIIEKYSYIPERLARKYYNKGIENDDIYQIACVGLINAVERFDPEKGIKFTTFATPTIIGEIKRFFRDKGNFIKVPRKLYDIFTRASKIRNSYLAEKGTEIDRKELAKQMGVSVKLLEEAFSWNASTSVSSLENIEMEDGINPGGLYQIIGEEDDAFLMIEDADMVERFMDGLGDREKKFIRYRYYDCRTQREIAADLGVTQMQVSRIEKKILGMFKRMYLNSVEA